MMFFHRFVIFYILYLLICVNVTYSENDTTLHRAGVIFGPNLVFNQTQIPLISGADDCGNYSNGNAFSFMGGIFYNYKYIPELISFDFRIFYENRPVDLSQITNNYEILDPQTNQYTPFVRKHEYTGSLGYVTMDLGVKYKPLIDYDGFIRLGFDAGNPIISAEYENTEEIISPKGVLFPDEKLKHRVSGGNMNNTVTAFGINLGVSYSHKLKSGLIIEPELSYRKSLNSILKDVNWKQDIVRLTISIGYDFGTDNKSMKHIKDSIKNTSKIDTIPNVAIKSLESISSNEIYLRKTIVTQTYPILPYIFFDSLDNRISDTYLPNNSNEFDEKTLPKDNLKIYYRILDIIGSRMRKYPDSKLYLKGTQDSKESEVNPDYNIALDRAESVKMYISMKWGIDTNRLICGYLKKATLPTSELYQEGFVENRRVEVSSDNLKILEPVIHTKFAEYIYENENIEIKPKLNDNIKSSQIEFILNNNKIKSYTSDSLSNNFNVNDIFENTVLKETDNLRIKYKVINSQNLTEELQQSIPIKISDNQYEIGRLNLIVFDFDRFDLTEINKSMIENFIKYAVFDKSKVNITGSTDKLGEMNYNMNLSQNRAENVATFLKSIVPNIKINNIKGIGPSLLKYDNSTPEGRFYSRTVMIEVETPIK